MTTTNPVIDARDLGIRFLRGSRRAMLRAALGDLFGRSRPGTTTGGDDEPGSLWALRHVDLQLPAGTCLGVCGSNGAGKTTLLRMLAGIYDPDEGSVSVAGRTSVLLSLGAATSHHLSGRDNVRLAGKVLGLESRHIEALYPQVCEFAELDAATMATPVRYYSSGMRTRLGFAIASVLEPDVLLLDEILAVGDQRFRTKSAARLDELMGRARAIVVSSHSVSFLKEHCDHGLWIENGRVQACGPGLGAFNEYARFAGIRP